MAGMPGQGHGPLNEAAARLREVGHIVINPAEVDQGETEDTRGMHEHSHYMRNDLRELLTCDALALLDGWEKSRGCLIEFNTAVSVGLDVYRYWSDQKRIQLVQLTGRRFP